MTLLQGAGSFLGLVPEEEPGCEGTQESTLANGSKCRSRCRTSSPRTETDWTWALPGKTVACGRDPDNLPLRWRVCPAGHAVPYIDACDSRGCPTCWRKGWLRREAGALAEKLAAEAKTRHDQGERWRVVHVSLNPPPSQWDLPDLRSFHRLRSRAYRVARKAGLDGGAMVFHRVRCADRTDPTETDGPHFHVLGFGWIGPDARAKSGWVVKNHGTRGDRRSIVGTAQYILSHSHRAEGILPEGKSEGLTLTVTWFGRQVPASEIVSEGVYCPLCGVFYSKSEWLDLEWIGQGPPPTEPVTVDWAQWRAYVLDFTAAWRGNRVDVR